MTRKATVKKTGKLIEVRWDAVCCVWRDINHRGKYDKFELDFI